MPRNPAISPSYPNALPRGSWRSPAAVSAAWRCCVVAQAVEGRRLREENVQLKRALKQRYNFPNIIGKSEKMLTLFDLVSQVAPSRSTVLIMGESGTGKELIAKAIHSASTRAEKSFVPVNSG